MIRDEAGVLVVHAANEGSKQHNTARQPDLFSNMRSNPHFFLRALEPFGAIHRLAGMIPYQGAAVP